MKDKTIGEVYLKHLLQLSPLFSLGREDDRQRISHVFNLLTKESLDYPRDRPYEGLSRINADGVPFQLSLCIGPGNGGLRFLCEAGVPGTSTAERIRFSCEKLRELTMYLDAEPAMEPMQVFFSNILPAEDAVPDHWKSGVWFALGFFPEFTLAKIYFNLNRGSPREIWKRVGSLFHDLGRIRSLEELCRVSGIVSRDSWPTGLAVDILPGGELGRIKMYFRSGAVKEAYLKRWVSAVFPDDGDEKIRMLLDGIPRQGNCFSEGAFVSSLEFPAEERENWRLTSKIDLNIGKTGIHSDLDAFLMTRRLASLIGLPSRDYTDSLQRILGAGSLSRTSLDLHRFVGVGLEADGNSHINIYIQLPRHINVEEEDLSLNKSFPWVARPVNQSQVLDSLERSVRFLHSSRRSDSIWEDFSMPVGISDIWVTAYTGFQLLRKPEIALDRHMETQLLKAAAWLQQNESEKVGWGYNGNVEPDSDSTGYALLFLGLSKIPVSSHALSGLSAFRQPDHGFSTYKRANQDDTWGKSHPEVTAVVLEVLRKFLPQDTDLIRSTAQYLCGQQHSMGFWPSYWWFTPMYSTCAVLRTVRHFPDEWNKEKLMSYLENYEAAGAFESALLAESLLLAGCRTSEEKLQYIILGLMDTQNSDGSWPSSAMLRLSQPDTADHWKLLDAGAPYIDQNRIFTTATVAGTLKCLLYSLEK